MRPIPQISRGSMAVPNMCGFGFCDDALGKRRGGRNNNIKRTQIERFYRRYAKRRQKTVSPQHPKRQTLKARGSHIGIRKMRFHNTCIRKKRVYRRRGKKPVQHRKHPLCPSMAQEKVVHKGNAQWMFIYHMATISGSLCASKRKGLRTEVRRPFLDVLTRLASWGR